MGEALVVVENLKVLRSGTSVLNGVSLSIQKGGAYAIVGESGSGKTTLLYTLLGLIPIASGSVRVSGKNPVSLSARERAKLMGLVFQEYALFPHMTVEANIEFAPRQHGLTDITKHASELLGHLGIESLRKRYPHEISGGQKQRVAIARSLMLAPDVIFFDEPSAALDLKTTRELASLLAQLSEKTQVVIVSHDLPFIEMFCERGCLMREGTVQLEGPLKSLLSDSHGETS